MSLFDKNDVIAICKPMHNFFDVDYMAYSRVYRDGSEATLTTHPQWVETYMSQQLYCDNPLEKSIDNFSNSYFLWQRSLDNSVLSQMFWQQLQIERAFIIVRPNELADYCEFYYFGTKCREQHFEKKCLSNIDLIDNFINHFNNCAADMIETLDQQRINISGKFEDNRAQLSDYEHYHDAVIDRQQFICDLSKSGSIIKLGDELIKLTKREAEMTPYIMTGLSTKEIARRCHISPRTVETHLAHIKEKTSASSKYDLILKLRSTHILTT
ncbi:MAG: helix-turn-helix transcriptional regulator [Coxiellaceae bacterium]|nr:helix-turn-helix transcriptional regulator [Coxiellaceae bacterium]